VTRHPGKLLVLAVLLLTGGVGILRWRHQQAVEHFPESCRSAAGLQNWNALETLSREWLEEAPEEPVAWFWLGESLRFQRQFPEAEDAYRHVALGQLRGIDATIERMQLQFHVFHDPETAMQLADELLAFNSRLADPIRNRIYYFAMTSQRAALLKEIKRAIEVQADLPVHFVYLASLEEIGFRDADVVTGKWLAASPDNQFFQAVNLVHRARNARANWLTSPTAELKTTLDGLLQEVSALHKALPAEPVLLEFLMNIAMDNGNVDQIGELLAMVPDSAADDPVFWLWRGRYALLTSDYEEAESSLARAIELHPLAWQARNEFATLLRSTERPEEAGEMQELAAEGTDIANEIRRLAHARDVQQPILDRIAKFADACEEWPIAHAVYRRRDPAQQQ
jgi:tetratricopeptide (TPR) repeat protein